MTLTRAALRQTVEALAAALIEQCKVSSVRSVSTGEEAGLHFVEIQLLVPEHIYEDDELLDEVYLAFQSIESGEMVVTVAAQPDRRN
ncbi:hypothetical protein [Deinococcus altitudinis]|uniref:hypothetical protein n=1 Tax=Deinococcus altitudinis TaxID=468914 RepID=UPI003891D0F8